jgi:hypothetical protein
MLFRKEIFSSPVAIRFCAVAIHVSQKGLQRQSYVCMLMFESWTQLFMFICSHSSVLESKTARYHCARMWPIHSFSWPWPKQLNLEPNLPLTLSVLVHSSGSQLGWFGSYGFIGLTVHTLCFRNILSKNERETGMCAFVAPSLPHPTNLQMKDLIVTFCRFTSRPEGLIDLSSLEAVLAITINLFPDTLSSRRHTVHSELRSLPKRLRTIRCR